MRQNYRGATPRFRRSVIGTAVTLALAAGTSGVQAFEFKSGEVSGSFDTTVSLGGLWRMESPEKSLISIANRGASRDPNSDDGNLRYKRNELVSTTLKAMLSFSKSAPTLLFVMTFSSGLFFKSAFSESI